MSLLSSALNGVWHSDAAKTISLAAFGTLFGAWVSKRSETKRTVIAELRAIRAALAVCFTVCNRALAVKRQHVLPMYQKFAADTQLHSDFVRTQQGPLVIRIEYLTLTRPAFATHVLERLVFEKTSLGSKGLATTVDLMGVVDNLERSIDYHTKLIDEFRDNPTGSVLAGIERYLGVSNAAGQTDARYQTSVTGIWKLTDDCIFFSRVLADELTQYGNKLRNRYKWRYRLPVGRLEHADWSIAINAGLIPPDEQYADWLRGFKRPASWLEGVKRRIQSWGANPADS